MTGSLFLFVAAFFLASSDSVGSVKPVKTENASADDLIWSVPMVPEVINASLGVVYSEQVNRTNEFIFVYSNQHVSSSSALRVFVSSDGATLNLPLLFAVRQQRGIRSWPVPIAIHRGGGQFLYHEVNKTICPVQNYVHSRLSNVVSEDVFLEVSTISRTNVDFSVVLRQDNISIGLDCAVDLEVSPSSTRFVRFDFPNDTDVILVRVTSPDDLCATVSVQNVSCPIFDSEEDVTYGNTHQTMTFKAGITVQRRHFPVGLFVVFVVHGDDYLCSRSFQNLNTMRIKRVSVLIEEKISRSQYLTATLGALGFCGLFYLLSMVLSLWHYVRQRRERRQISAELSPVQSAATTSSNYGAMGTTGSDTVSNASSETTAVLRVAGSSTRGATIASGGDSDSSVDDDESDVDMLPEADYDKDLFRAKRSLCVADLSRKKPRVLKRKTQLYSWHVITVAVFYGVPVVQLVITYQKMLNTTGDQDTCYYNFLCAHPFGLLSDFNHVYSNIGYMALGLLFMGLVKRREMMHQLHLQLNDRFEKSCGIPRHFGLFYAMGVALMMEGVLSACYHVCPSYSNFQFDTAFMYVIAVLCMLRIYETRHPDINANAYATFLMLACTMVIGVVGVWLGGIYFWSMFIALHLCVCVLLTAQIYYMGRWSFGPSAVYRMFHSVRNDLVSSPRHCCQPLYPDRMILLVVANLCNIALAVAGAMSMKTDFASYLLAIFITNLLLYTFFYIVMKLRHKEKILLQTLVYILLCSLSWAAALFFFLRKSISWQSLANRLGVGGLSDEVRRSNYSSSISSTTISPPYGDMLTPAESRVHNRQCEILNFYDDHDIWHFLSASSMFFGFMILLTWDDDLVFTPRDQIPVF